MPVFRIQKNNNYTVMSNYHLRDKELSLKAKGLMSFILSLPEDWDYSLKGLVSCLKEGKESVDSTLDELKARAYIKVTKIQNEKGQFKYIYNIFEQPSENPEGKKPGVENPGMVEPDMENPPQINTNIINTKKENNICSSSGKEDNISQLADDFDKIWSIYPRKDGKNTAFKHYLAWLKGKMYAGRNIKLTNKQMWYATKRYATLIEEAKTEKQYIKMGSTFFNEAIMEYVNEEGMNE